jgi:outer membrane murein-binding lipoprotein Lpp
MKRLMVLFCLVLVVFPLVVAGCGVAKSDYEAVVAERDVLQAEKDALQAEKNSLEADIDALEADIDALETELDTTKADVMSLVTVLDKKIAAVVMINGYFADALDYIAGGMSEYEATAVLATFLAEFGDVIDAVGNEELSQLWDNAEAAAALNDVDGFVANLTAIMDLLSELIDADIAAIEARLI